MDLLINIVAGSLVEIGKCICGCIYPKIKSIAKFQSNLDNLIKDTEILVNLRNSVKAQIQSAENDGNRPRPAVVEWLEKVEAVEKEVNMIQASIRGDGDVETLCNRCRTCCLCSIPAVKVVEKLKEVKGLIETDSFSYWLFFQDRQLQKVEHMLGPSIEGQSTASKNLLKVLQLLDADEVSRIGVWGMGGVGKTTLVKNLNNKLQTASLRSPFSIVIWVTVSKQSDVRRVQTQIAERLNVEIGMGDSVDITAGRLYDRLRKEKRFLLILDGVWEPIKLDDLGVQNLEDGSGHKVILTTRSLKVCKRMKTDANVKVDVLNEEESWNLFTQKAGNDATDEEIEPFAKAVAKECGGLPLAIIVVGASMRGEKMVELWKDALNALRRSVPSVLGIEDEVYKPLKWSYDSLEGKGFNVKSCFLYCCLYPEDYSIKVSELVHSWLGEGLIDELQNYEDSFNRGIALVESMKDSCLLEIGQREGTVKMHDVVRDVAIWIAGDECKSLIRSGIGLIQISEGEVFDYVKRVSFMNNILAWLPDWVVFPEASTLLLIGTTKISERFFPAFKALKVLNLSKTDGQELPRSLLQLRELRALILRKCRRLEVLPPLGELSRLQLLDCSYTAIKEIPPGLEDLTKLRQLDLSYTHFLRRIGPGIICQLSSLEVFDMTDSAYQWGFAKPGEGEALFDELECLNRLSVLSIQLDISCLGSGSFSWLERLKKFHFVIIPIYKQGFRNILPDDKYDMRKLIICDLHFFSGRDLHLSGKLLGWLLNNATCVILNGYWELEKIHTYLGEDHCFNALRSLTIIDYDVSRLNGGSSNGQEILYMPNLEELILDAICGVEIASVSEFIDLFRMEFPKLKVIRVSDCHSIKYLLSVRGSNLNMQNLEEVTVRSCKNLEELFVYSDSASRNSSHVSVPKLRIVDLWHLPKLKTLCEPSESWRSLEELQVTECDLLKKLHLSSKNAETIKEIRGELQWWNQLEWDEEDTKSILQRCFIHVERKISPDDYRLSSDDEWISFDD